MLSCPANTAANATMCIYSCLHAIPSSMRDFINPLCKRKRVIVLYVCVCVLVMSCPLLTKFILQYEHSSSLFMSQASLDFDLATDLSKVVYFKRYLFVATFGCESAILCPADRTLDRVDRMCIAGGGVPSIYCACPTHNVTS